LRGSLSRRRAREWAVRVTHGHHRRGGSPAGVVGGGAPAGRLASGGGWVRAWVTAARQLPRLVSSTTAGKSSSVWSMPA